MSTLASRSKAVKRTDVLEDLKQVDDLLDGIERKDLAQLSSSDKDAAVEMLQHALERALELFRNQPGPRMQHP